MYPFFGIFFRRGYSLLICLPIKYISVILYPSFSLLTCFSSNSVSTRSTSVTGLAWSHVTHTGIQTPHSTCEGEPYNWIRDDTNDTATLAKMSLEWQLWHLWHGLLFFIYWPIPENMSYDGRFHFHPAYGHNLFPPAWPPEGLLTLYVTSPTGIGPSENRMLLYCIVTTMFTSNVTDTDRAPEFRGMFWHVRLCGCLSLPESVNKPPPPPHRLSIDAW
jgi:hypothetical protein